MTDDGGRSYTCAVEDRPGLASVVVDALSTVGARADEVAVHQPSLDDVFLPLTGHRAEEPTDDHDLEVVR